MKKVFKIFSIVFAIIFAIGVIYFAEPNAYVLASPDISTLIKGNDSYENGDLGCDWIKSGDSPGVGTQTLNKPGVGSIILTVAQSTTSPSYTYVSSWSSTGVTVYYIVVKGGNDHYLYTYNGGSTRDDSANLKSPLNNGENIADISHITIGYKIIQSTSTPTDPGATATPSPTPTDPEATPTPTPTPSNSQPGQTQPVITQPVFTIPDQTIPGNPATELPDETTPSGALAETGEQGIGIFTIVLALLVLIIGVALIMVGKRTHK